MTASNMFNLSLRSPTNAPPLPRSIKPKLGQYSHHTIYDIRYSRAFIPSGILPKYILTPFSLVPSTSSITTVIEQGCGVVTALAQTPPNTRT